MNTQLNLILLYGRCREKEEIEVFRRFVEAIFYVGKGKNARSLQHLKDAQDYLKQKKHKVRICIYLYLSNSAVRISQKVAHYT